MMEYMWSERKKTGRALLQVHLWKKARLGNREALEAREELGDLSTYVIYPTPGLVTIVSYFIPFLPPYTLHNHLP